MALRAEQLASLVAAAAARGADAEAAYAAIVQAFQDMAFGYAYALLGDFHLAEDAAQEAFVEAYLNLARLREAAAFPGWLRRIVFHRCQRALRRRRHPMLPLDSLGELASASPSPLQQAETRELHERVEQAIASLSLPLREVTTLFYIDGYSHEEVSDFLELPVGTVKSRLNASRAGLKRRLLSMVRETLESRKPAADFARRVIDGVPRISYQAQGAKVELCPFPSALKACLEAMGQTVAYEELMAASGAAFRLVWNPALWDGSNVDLALMAADPLEPHRRAFEAAGRAFETIGHAGVPHAALPDVPVFDSYVATGALRARVVGSIRDRQRPVIALGVVGPPEAAVVTGFDEEGAVLIGWSYFQDMPPLAGKIDFEPSGYFRQRDWSSRTPGVFLIGERIEAQAPPPDRDRRVLEWALSVARTPTVHDRATGLAAYQAWAEALARDEDFPAGSLDALRERLEVHDDAMMTVAEGRWYASVYLPQIARRAPFQAEHLLAASACYAAEHRLMWEGWGLVGGIGRGQAQALALAKPEIRRDLSRVILAARDQDRAAANHIERALAVETPRPSMS